MEPKIMKILDKIFKNLNPRYLLALDRKIYNNKEKKYLYRFKLYGCHSFVKYTFNEIEIDENIAYQINPYDLIEIALNEYKHKNKSRLFKIIEHLRNNRYKISNSGSVEIINGEDLLYDPFLIKKIKRTDIRTICHKTGVIHGRKLSKKISNEVSHKSSKSNVFKLTLT